MTAYLIVCPLVFLAGLVDSIAGGGGLISLPGYLIAGVPAHMALGTNKMSSTIGTSISAVRLFKTWLLKRKNGYGHCIGGLCHDRFCSGSKNVLTGIRVCDPAYDDRCPSYCSLSCIKK